MSNTEFPPQWRHLSYWDTFAEANTPGNVAYAPGEVVTLSANTTLYAQWTKNP